MKLPSTLSRAAAPRKGPDVHAAQQDPIHVAAAFTLRTTCKDKELMLAWKIDRTTAFRYRTGAIVGALTRIAWELVLLERSGKSVRPILRFLLRAARHGRRTAPHHVKRLRKGVTA